MKPIDLDSVQIFFERQDQLLLNAVLAIIMFGIALGFRKEQFQDIVQNPSKVAIGLLSQFFVLPIVTYIFVLLVEPQPSVALGIFLIAACPGGSVSNFLTHLAGGNIALSIAMTTVSTIAAVLFTPLNFQFWASQYPPSALLLQDINIHFWDVALIIVQLIGLPIALGIVYNYFFPRSAQFLSRLVKPLSVVVFLSLILIAFVNNYSVFLATMSYMVAITVAHNTLALGSGLAVARSFKMEWPDQISIMIETGIQNSGLALILIFSFFNGLGGMMLLAAYWGVWHLISGLLIAFYCTSYHQKNRIESIV